MTVAGIAFLLQDRLYPSAEKLRIISSKNRVKTQ
jgi:hypothetical protein